MADFMRTNEYTIPQFQKAIDAFFATGGACSTPLAVFR